VANRGRAPEDSVADNVRDFYAGLLKQQGVEQNRLGHADASAAANQ